MLLFFNAYKGKSGLQPIELLTFEAASSPRARLEIIPLDHLTFS